ncbi:hypothetical protein [Desulfovibrio sp. ZJ200]|uniref:hypothetical protein n=1 Tax=Desulfovibrio sp. ZJ200 TaxID=2709792 RepID=UPI0013E9EB4B|nr:hypothetical protein [Desulfovibrio sp. ZJ200]
MNGVHALFRLLRLRGVFSFVEDAHFIASRLQAEFIHAGGLVRAEKGGGTGAEEFSQAERQSADDHFGQAARIEHFLFENALLTRKRQPPQRGVHSGENRVFRLNATFDFHKKSKVICSRCFAPDFSQLYTCQYFFRCNILIYFDKNKSIKNTPAITQKEGDIIGR